MGEYNNQNATAGTGSWTEDIDRQLSQGPATYHHHQVLKVAGSMNKAGRSANERLQLPKIYARPLSNTGTLAPTHIDTYASPDQTNQLLSPYPYTPAQRQKYQPSPQSWQYADDTATTASQPARPAYSMTGYQQQLNQTHQATIHQHLQQQTLYTPTTGSPAIPYNPFPYEAETIVERTVLAGVYYGSHITLPPYSTTGAKQLNALSSSRLNIPNLDPRLLPSQPAVVNSSSRPPLQPRTDPLQTPSSTSSHGLLSSTLVALPSSISDGQENSFGLRAHQENHQTHGAPPFPQNGSKGITSLSQRATTMSRNNSQVSASSSTGRSTKSDRLSTITEHQCDACRQHFLTANDLSHHIRNTHTERPLQCKQCGKLFVYNKDVERHEKDAHSNVRPWYCSDRNCAYAIVGFKRKDQLLRHERGKGCPKAISADMYVPPTQGYGLLDRRQ